MMHVAESQLLIRLLEIAEMGFLFNMRRGEDGVSSAVIIALPCYSVHITHVKF